MHCDKGKPSEKVGRKAKGPSVQTGGSQLPKGDIIEKILGKLLHLYIFFIRTIKSKRNGGIIMLKKMNKIAVTTLLLSAMGTSTAFAAETTTTSAIITGGTLTIAPLSSPPTFTELTLNGTTQEIASTETTTTTITDATGTGAGWRVNLKASQFKNTGVVEPSDDPFGKLPNNSLKLGGVTITPVDNSSDKNTVTVSNADQTIDNDTGVTILSAAENGGMGTYTVSIAPMTLTLLPKSTKAGTYESTITITLTQGIE